MTLPVPMPPGSPISAQVNVPDFANPYGQQMQRATADTNAFTAALDKMQQKLDGITQRAGSKLIHFAASDVAAFSGAAADAANYEHSLSTLNATSKITPLNMDQVKRSIDNTFTSLPVSRAEVVSLTTALTTMGVTGSRDLGTLVNIVLKLRAATGEDAGALAGGLIQLSRLTGNMHPEAIGNLANALLTVSRNAGVAVSDVLSFSQAIAPLAHQAGIGSAQILGIAAAFSKAGANGYVAANTFNSIISDITRLSQSGSPELAKYANLIGVSVGHLRSMDKTTAIERIFHVIARQGPQAINTLNRLGIDGVRAVSAVTAVVQSGHLNEQVRKSLGASHDQKNLDRAAAGGFDGVVNSITKIRNELTQIGEQFGGPMLSGLELFFNTLAKAGHIVNMVLTPFAPLLDFIGALAAAFTALGGATLLATGLLAKVAVAGFVGRSSPIQAFMAGRSAGMGRTLSGTQAVYQQRAAQGVLPWYQSPAYSRGQAIGAGNLAAQQRFAAVNAERAAQGLAPIAQPGFISRMAARPVRLLGWGVGQQADFYRTAGMSGVNRPPGVLGWMGERAARTRSWVTGTPYVPRGAPGSAEAAPPPRVFGVGASGVAEEQGAGAAASAAATKARISADEMVAAADKEMAESNIKVADANLKHAEAEAKVAASVTESADVQMKAQVGLAEATRNLAAAFARLEVATILAGTATAGNAAKTGIMAGLKTRAGSAMGMGFTGMLAGSLISDPNKPYGARSQVGEMVTSTAMGAAIGTLAIPIPGVGTAIGAGLGAVYGWLNRPTAPPKPIPTTPTDAFRSGARRTGTTDPGRDLMRKNLIKTGVWGTLLKFGAKPAEILDEFTKGSVQSQQDFLNSHLPGPIGGFVFDQTRGEVAKYQAGTLQGLRGYNAFQRRLGEAGPLSGVLNSSTTIAGYYRHPDDPARQYSAQQELLRRAGGTPYEGLQTASLARSTAGTVAWLDRLAGGLKDATDPLYQLSRAARTAALAQLATQMPYMSRVGQLRATAGVYTEAARINTAHPTADSAKDLETARDTYNQQMEAYHQYTIQVQQTAIQFGIQRTRAEEDYQHSITISTRDFNIQLAQTEQDYQISRLRSQEDYQIQTARSSEDFWRGQARAAEDAAKSIYAPFDRVQAKFTEDASTLSQNLTDQNQRIFHQMAQLRQLRSAGLSQQSIDTLQLADSGNSQQVDNLVQTMSPELIAKINRQVAARLQATKSLTQSSFSQSYRREVQDFNIAFDRTQADFERGLAHAEQDYNRARQRAVDAQDRALGDMAYNYDTQVTRTAQDLTTAMTELYGTFADSTGSSLQAVINNIEKYAPKIAHTLEREMKQAQNIVQRTVGDVTVGVMGVNAKGNVGTYDAQGKWTPYMGTLHYGEYESLPRVYSPITGHATGSISLREHAALFSEGNRPEANIPLDQRGVNFMVGFANQVSQAMMRQQQGRTNPLTGAGTGGSYSYNYDYSTQYTGDIKVEARDPEELGRKLEEKKRMQRLVAPPHSAAHRG